MSNFTVWSQCFQKLSAAIAPKVSEGGKVLTGGNIRPVNPFPNVLFLTQLMQATLKNNAYNKEEMLVIRKFSFICHNVLN